MYAQLDWGLLGFLSLYFIQETDLVYRLCLLSYMKPKAGQ